MACTLTIVRHGQTTANKDGILQGQADWPLSDLGIQTFIGSSAYLRNMSYW